MRRLKAHAIGAAAAATLLGLAVSAAALRGGTDPAGDVANPAYDIRGAMVQTKRCCLRHVVTVLDANGQTKNLTAIDLRAGGKRYIVRPGAVERFWSGKRTGGAKAKRRFGNDIVLTYRRKAIGNPRRIKWKAIVGGDDAGSFDVAPDYGRVRTRIR